MLDAEEQLSEQLESLPYLVRFQYEKSRWVWKQYENSWCVDAV
jgi:hypothetical protein